MGLKQDIVTLIGSLFGRDTAEIFEKYYDETKPGEILSACKGMLSKLLGPDIADRYIGELVNKYPRMKKKEVSSK